MPSGRAFITGIEYELGDTDLPAEELPGLADEPDLRENLLSAAGGFLRYHVSTTGICELSRSPIDRALSRSKVDRAKIDWVLFATDCLSDEPDARSQVSLLMSDLYMSNAFPISVGLADCSSGVAAVAMAAEAVKTGRVRSALVVSSDPWGPSATSRLVAGGTAIASDAAVAIVIAQEPGPNESFEITNSSNHVAYDLLRPDVDARAQMLARVEAYRRLFALLWQDSPDNRPANVSQVFPCNFASDLLRLYYMDVGFTEEQLFLENIPRTGHCLGSDPFIGLADFVSLGRSKNDQEMVLVGSGVGTQAAVELRLASP